MFLIIKVLLNDIKVNTFKYNSSVCKCRDKYNNSVRILITTIVHFNMHFAMSQASKSETDKNSFSARNRRDLIVSNG